MGQGYSSIIRDADLLFDHGQLEEAEAKYLAMEGQAAPANASDETLLLYASCKLQASMNLAIINMCKGNYPQAEKYMGAATQLEMRHSDAQRQHHVNTLAVFYLAATSIVAPKPEAEHALQKVVTMPFVRRALEARAEHANLVHCAHAWLLHRLGRPSLVSLAPLQLAEPMSSRIVYNTPESYTATLNFEVDGELEGVELDQEDDIGDVPSDEDDDGLTGPSSSPLPRPQPEIASPNHTVSSPDGTSQDHPVTTSPHPILDSKATRSNPGLELLKAIILSDDTTVDPVQIQALAQAARAMGIQLQSMVYEGGQPFLYSTWRTRGRALTRAGHHQASIVAYVIALACNWTFLEAWVDVAHAYASSGDDKTARLYLSILTDILAPNESVGWMERSLVCMNSGRFAEAAMCCDRVSLDIDPQNIVAWERRAFATLQLRRWNSRAVAEALNMTDSALAINPFHTASLRTKAQALMDHGRFQEALSALDVLLSRDPHDIQAIHAKAVVLRHNHQYSDALTWHKKAIAADPHSPDLSLHLSICYFQMATNLAPHDEAHHNHNNANGANSSEAPPSPSDTPGPSATATPPVAGSSIDGRNGSPSSNNSNGTSAVANLRASTGSITTSMNCDPSLMPDGTFIGTLPFNQADAVEFPNMLTVMRHLHAVPRMVDVNRGFEATEAAMDVATHYPDHDGPLHFFFEPSSLPRTKGSAYADDPEAYIKLQSRFVKSQIWATRALLLAHGNRISEALSAIDHAVEEAPECPSMALVAKGDVFMMAGKPADEILRVYLSALDTEPNSEFAHLAIIHLLLLNREAKAALKHTTRLVALADEGYLLNPRLAYELHASTLFHLASYDAAYKFCLQHIPKEVIEEAGAEESTAPEEDTYTVRLLNIVAHSLHQLGKCDEAQSWFDRSLRPDPMNVYTWNEKARCLMMNKRFDDALHYFDRALVLNPEDLRTKCNRALCLCLLGNIAEGAEILMAEERGPSHKAATEWLQSLSAIERGFHFDSMAAAREQKKRLEKTAKDETMSGSDEM